MTEEDFIRKVTDRIFEVLMEEMETHKMLGWIADKNNDQKIVECVEKSVSHIVQIYREWGIEDKDITVEKIIDVMATIGNTMKS